MAPSSGSSWNAARIDSPEFKRYDGLNGEWRIDDIDADTLYLSSASLGNYEGTDVRWSNFSLDGATTRFVMAKAVASSAVDIVGPFVFDLGQPFAISSVALVLDQEIYKGAYYSTLSVASGASLVGAGYLLFKYGFASQTGPIRTFGATDDYTLQIDSGFKFPVSLSPGDVINILYQRAAFEPTGYSGSFWLTASNAGRAAAIELLKEISASGIELNITTRYPGDRGLGGEGYPTADSQKLSDIVEVFGQDDIDAELAEARSNL